MVFTLSAVALALGLAWLALGAGYLLGQFRVAELTVVQLTRIWWAFVVWEVSVLIICLWSWYLAPWPMPR